MTPVRRARGLALVTAVFLITALVAIGVAVATMAKVEHDTGTKSLVAAKVYFGAKAGLDWGIQQGVMAAACAASSSFTLSQGGLNGVSVTVTCASQNFGGSDNVYYLTSVATFGTLGNADYAERRMEATVSNIP
jgi:MSHA biogenesis protein MshP